MWNPIFIDERLAKWILSLRKAPELDTQCKVKKSHQWALDGEKYQPVDDISALSDYQRRQNSLQTIQNNVAPFLYNKRIYSFVSDMDATNSGILPMNKKQKMYCVSFQKNRTYASKN